MNEQVKRRLGWFGAATVLGTAADLLSKEWAVRALSELPGQAMMVFSPWLEWALTYNRGTAFSLIRDLGAARWFFGVFALVVVGMLAWMAAQAHSKWEAAALGALAGGAIGNGWDRTFRVLADGGTGVVDFAKVNYPWGGSWPTFNVADALIVVGGIGLVWQWWAQRKTRSNNLPG